MILVGVDVLFVSVCVVLLLFVLLDCLEDSI